MKGDRNQPLYPVINSCFKPIKNLTKNGELILQKDVSYKIMGWGKTKPNDSGERTEFWVIQDTYNLSAKEVIISKETINNLWTKGVIEDEVKKIPESKKNYY